MCYCVHYSSIWTMGVRAAARVRAGGAVARREDAGAAAQRRRRGRVQPHG